MNSQEVLKQIREIQERCSRDADNQDLTRDTRYENGCTSDALAAALDQHEPDEQTTEEQRETIKKLQATIDRQERFMLQLGDLCDSPDSLRGHVAEACEAILVGPNGDQRRKEITPTTTARWKAWLSSDK